MANLSDITDKYGVDIIPNKSRTKAIGKKRRAWLPAEDECAQNQKNDETQANTNKTTSKKSYEENLTELLSTEIVNWEHHDRPSSELGDIAALAEEFKTIGQQQPCVVRPHPTLSNYYELIIGERRWRACKLANIPVKVIIRELSDTDAALAQAAENDNRVDLSDYAKGMSYSKLIKAGVIKQIDLVEKLGKSKQYVSALLSFSKIPDEVLTAIGDMTKVSASSAETIKQLSNKGRDHIDALLKLAQKISEGKLGGRNLTKTVSDMADNQKRIEKENKKILSKDGRHIFTWRSDNNNKPSIHFPNNIADLLANNDLDIEELTLNIANLIEVELSRLKETKKSV